MKNTFLVSEENIIQSERHIQTNWWQSLEMVSMGGHKTETVFLVCLVFDFCYQELASRIL